jgi:hypothetical protein
MSRKYGCKADKNQPEIVEAIRKLGGTVLHLHTLGHGAPDICIGYGGLSLLAEIKDGGRPLSAQKLTKDEQEWHSKWTGGCYLIRNVEDAAKAVNTLKSWGMKLREAAC